MNEIQLAKLDAILRQAPVVPVLVVDELSLAVPLARALVAGGLKVLEVTLRSDVALAAIAAMVREVPDAIVGAGTVLNARHLAQVVETGAQFAISPGATASLLAAGSAAPIPLLPGVATSSEIMQGLAAGYSRFKFFPAEAAGGVAMLKSFSGPFADVRFCPTGGIDASSAASYLRLPNVVTVGGSWMAPAAMVKAQNWSGITELARACCALR